MNNFSSQDTREFIMATLLLVVLLCVINPGHFWMPDMLAMTLSALLLVVFSIFAAFVWRERASDEREQLHKLLAGHTAFIIGASVLTLGLIFQSFSHATDPWLALALGAMVLAKLAGIIWARKKQ